MQSFKAIMSPFNSRSHVPSASMTSSKSLSSEEPKLVSASTQSSTRSIQDKAPPVNKNLNPQKATEFSGSVPRRFPRKLVVFKGVKFQLYSLAWLASLSDKSPRAIHKWERLGIFPTPIFRFDEGYRWYCAAEIHGYRHLIRAAGLRSGRYADAEKKTLWLKRNSFDFKAKLQGLLKDRIGMVPTKLVDEDAILKKFAGTKAFKLTEADVVRLIKS